MWVVDAARKINFVFLSQFMPPTSYPVWGEVEDALIASGPNGLGAAQPERALFRGTVW
jgi:hypothetical protein